MFKVLGMGILQFPFFLPASIDYDSFDKQYKQGNYAEEEEEEAEEEKPQPGT